MSNGPDALIYNIIATCVELTDTTWGSWLARLTNPLDPAARDELWSKLAWAIDREELDPAYKVAVIADVQSCAQDELNRVMGSAASLSMSLHLESTGGLR